MSSVLYDDSSGPVARVVNFIHDELLLEMREDAFLHERVMAVCEIMVEAMRFITPDVTPRVEPALMRRWDKRAEPVYDNNGRLTIWTPEGDS